MSLDYYYVHKWAISSEIFNNIYKKKPHMKDSFFSHYTQ